jgi:hypothetical protein
LHQEKSGNPAQQAKILPIWDRCYEFLNIFTKKSAKKLRFLTQNKYKLCKKVDHNIGFREKRHFIRRKLAKIVIITPTPGHPDPSFVVDAAFLSLVYILLSLPILQLSSQLSSRVTRLGEFQPNGCLITSGIFVPNKQKNSTNNLATFSRKWLYIYFREKWIGLHFG